MVSGVLSAILQPQLLLFIVLGVGAGIFIGCLPGLTSTMGVALVLPLTFGMQADVGIMLLLGVYLEQCMEVPFQRSFFARREHLRLQLLCWMDMNFQKRRGRTCLGIIYNVLFVGGVVSCIVLMLVAPQLAKLALKFSSPEFFMLAVLD